MRLKAQEQVSQKISSQAEKLGVSLAGIVNAADLQLSPSHQLVQNDDSAVAAGGSFIVIALEHPEKRLSIDWWDGNQGTAGNRRLIRIAKNLAKWLKKDLGMTARILPYHFKPGGLFIKDAAVLSGLGVVGRNNLVITPRCGPRIRFKALHVSVSFISSDLISFQPCVSCAAPCLTACPRNVFENGEFNSRRCLEQMRLDEANSTPVEIPGVTDRWGICIRYCRACELACPVGGTH